MKYYVYTMSHLGVIFYVGKGTGNRMFIHEKRARKNIKSNNNSSLFEKIFSIIFNNESIEYKKIFETDNECEAYKFEYETIEKIGLQNLCNLTKDYLKTSVSDRVKEGLSKSEKFKSVLELKRTLGVRQYYKEINLGEKNPRFGKKNTEEHMIAIKNSLIGVPKSEEHKNKISDALKGIKRSDDTKNKVSESLKKSTKFQEKVHSEEFRNTHRINTKKRHDELITYYFEYNGDEVIHKGGLQNMEENYDISFNTLRKLRYGKLEEWNGWRFIKMTNNSNQKIINKDV
jgi:hypothetical protein